MNLNETSGLDMGTCIAAVAMALDSAASTWIAHGPRVSLLQNRLGRAENLLCSLSPLLLAAEVDRRTTHLPDALGFAAAPRIIDVRPVTPVTLCSFAPGTTHPGHRTAALGGFAGDLRYRQGLVAAPPVTPPQSRRPLESSCLCRISQKGEYCVFADIVVAADFPKTTYMEVESQVSRYLSTLGVDAATVPGFAGYAGGWNALIMRFRAADEYSMSAIEWLTTQPGSPANQVRFTQERDLFGFFAQAVSAVESCCFATYHIGRLARPTHFGLPPESVTARASAVAFSSAFPSTPLDVALASLTASAEWKRMRDIRNMLIHRESPGRTVFLGSGPGYTPRPAEWTGLGTTLDAPLVELPRQWLAQETQELVDATHDFVLAEL